MKDKMLLLHTETVIDSAHYLKGYKGKCSNIHGHSTLIKVWVKGYPNQRDNVGILFDFGNVKELKELLDHKILNDTELFNEWNPTAENISIKVYNRFKSIYPELLFCIRIYETIVGKETWCQYGDFEI